MIVIYELHKSATWLSELIDAKIAYNSVILINFTFDTVGLQVLRADLYIGVHY